MLRLALTYQLILAVAVGPLLCCCSAGKALAGSRSTSKAPASSPARVPAKPAVHSCCSPKHQPAKSDPGHKSAPSNHGRPAEKCPCQDGPGKAPTAQADSTHSDLSTFLRTLAFDTTGPSVHPSSGVTVASFVGGCDGTRCLDHPLLTTAELLYAHHKLRC